MKVDALPQLSLLDDGSMYELEGRQYDRVTDIISAVLPPYLMPWAELVGIYGALRIYGAEGHLPDYMNENAVKVVKAKMEARGLDCDSQKDSGGTRGKVIHTCLERYIKHDEVPDSHDVDAEHAPYVQSLARFLLDYRPEFGAAELTVYHEELGYAGTLDAYGKITRQPKGARHPKLIGKKVLFDTKTNKAARVYFPQHHYQLAAYRYAWDTLGLPELDHEVVLGIGPARNGTGHYQVAVNYVAADEFPHIVNAYRSLTRARASNPKGKASGKRARPRTNR